MQVLVPASHEPPDWMHAEREAEVSTFPLMAWAEDTKRNEKATVAAMVLNMGTLRFVLAGVVAGRRGVLHSACQDR
jgi:hypothetical protein